MFRKPCAIKNWIGVEAAVPAARGGKDDAGRSKHPAGGDFPAPCARGTRASTPRGVGALLAPWISGRERPAQRRNLRRDPRVARGLLLALGFAFLWVGAVRAQNRPVTFNQDIAPLVYEHCTVCHRPGQAGPFALLTYADAKKHAKQMVEVTAKHYMPPWLPEGPTGEFQGDRRLSEAQIQMFQKWLAAGAPEGEHSAPPPLPLWPRDWQLGPPDLVVQMPQKYTLAAEGRDVYRNFVVPTGLTATRIVRAVEFKPGNRRIVHHAFVEVDYGGAARRLEGSDGQPGFEGMNLPEGVKMPGGYFLGWQPGKAPIAEPPGFGWTLEPGRDLVIRAHLRPTGKPEDLQAMIGFYFTDIPSTNTTFLLNLTSFNIDIPAGAANYLIEDSFVLPVAVDVLGVLPHAHYIGKELTGLARLPDGSVKRLLRIPDWDFNWQGDYRYVRPVHLPAWTSVEMRYTYDNSEANPHNPTLPPKRVRYGSESSDEMGELWLQVVLKDKNDAARLAEVYADKQMRRSADHARFQLESDPHDAKIRTRLGICQLALRQVPEAVKTFRTAIGDDPAYDEPHYYLGCIYRAQNHAGVARSEFETAVRLNPKNAKAFGNLGFIFMEAGDFRLAEHNFRKALRLDPSDQLAKEALEKVRGAKSNPGAESGEAR